MPNEIISPPSMPEGAKGSVKMSSSDKKEFDDMYEKIVAKVKSMH